MADPIHIIELLGAIAVFIFGNFIAIRGGLNGLKATVKTTHDDVKELKEGQSRIQDRTDSMSEKISSNSISLGRVEEKLESHAVWIRRLEATCAIRHPEGK